jgi:hypothetical protein
MNPFDNISVEEATEVQVAKKQMIEAQAAREEAKQAMLQADKDRRVAHDNLIAKQREHDEKVKAHNVACSRYKFVFNKLIEKELNPTVVDTEE